MQFQHESNFSSVRVARLENDCFVRGRRNVILDSRVDSLPAAMAAILEKLTTLSVRRRCRCVALPSVASEWAWQRGYVTGHGPEIPAALD